MPNRASVPPDIEELLQSFAAATREAEAVFARLPVEELEAPGSGGGWSPAQCLAHLALTNFAYLAEMRPAIKREIHLHNHARQGPWRVGLPTRLFLRYLEPPVQHRVNAPRAIAPAPRVEAQQALKDFVQSQEAIAALLVESAHLDLGRIRFPNPFLPGVRFTVGSGFLILGAHERRHLWQIAVSTSNG